jgi:hypothetical protein
MNLGGEESTTVVQSPICGVCDALGRLTAERYDHDITVLNGDDYEAA